MAPSTSMVSALDVAPYILKELGPLPAMKLQKLVYYSQAWSLVWDEQRLFHERIEAWAYGPVVPRLFRAHRGRFKVGTIPGDASRLDENQTETVDSVIAFYGEKSSQWLSDLTHLEAPWHETRESAGLANGERGSAQINIADMAQYYSSL